MMDLRDIEGEFRLSDAELALLRRARASFDRVIVILNTGGPIDMTWLREIDVDAVLFTGYAGMLSAHALVELLDGRVNPSGHLPDTWPWRFSDNPVSRNFPQRPADAPYIHEDAIGVRVYYEEDIYMGYRWFDSFGVPVAFPFGHGLSYTAFELTPAGLEREGDDVRVRLSVRNTGRRAGKAVAQLYVAPPRGAIEKPDHVLVGFEKTSLLAPGEVQTLEIAMRLEDAASFDEERSAWVLEAGEYGLFVGQSLGDLVPAGTLALEARTLRTVKAVAPPMEDFKRLTRADPTVDGSKSGIVPLGQQIAVPAPRGPGRREEPARSAPRRGGARPVARGASGPVEAGGFRRAAVADGPVPAERVRRDAFLPWQDGMAGHTPPLKAYGLPGFCASDANAGLNLKRPNVGFPASSVIAATFNREIAERWAGSWRRNAPPTAWTWCWPRA